jgi:integrase
MISINYQSYGTKGFNLRLRVYQNGKTKYLSVNHLLKGKLLKKHWNQKKQLFTASAPFSEENNHILVQFKQKYDELAIGWNGSLVGFFNSISLKKKASLSNKPTLEQLFSDIIKEHKSRKHPDGTTKGSYEVYEKAERRLKEYCAYRHLGYEKILVEDITPDFINSFFTWIDTHNNGKGKLYVSTMLHSVFAKADELGIIKFESLKGTRWCKKSRVSTNKYHTLTTAQCNQIMALSASELPENPKKLLYRDFCVFLLFTGQSPCDAISLKYSDIQVINGVSHFVFRRRKISEKQVVPCSVPINAKMQQIMDKWKPLSQDGYIFPIRNKHKLKTQKTNNGDIKHFVCRCNYWLKKLGEVIGCDFPLHCYTFRHTAITNYISKDIPVIYVANMMGTSVENCEKIYYNNQGDIVSRDKVLNVTSF